MQPEPRARAEALMYHPPHHTQACLMKIVDCTNIKSSKPLTLTWDAQDTGHPPEPLSPSKGRHITLNLQKLQINIFQYACESSHVVQ